MKKPYLLAFLITVNLNAGFSQSDKDVKARDVPQAVRDVLQKHYPEARNIRYYKEQEKDTLFYEVVFRNKDDRYSLLLFPDGRLYETEVVLPYEKLPSEARENIGKDLCMRFLKYRIRLVEEVDQRGSLKYEINVHGRKGKHSGYYELFYDRSGGFLEEKEETLYSIPSNSGF